MWLCVKRGGPPKKMVLPLSQRTTVSYLNKFGRLKEISKIPTPSEVPFGNTPSNQAQFWSKPDY